MKKTKKPDHNHKKKRMRALLDKSRQSIKAGRGLARDEFWQAFAAHKDDPFAPPEG